MRPHRVDDLGNQSFLVFGGDDDGDARVGHDQGDRT
jgi:hypothetical protein